MINSNIKIYLFCPIPEDQKPINEYIEIKENFLTNWPCLSNEKYKSSLISFFVYIFVFFLILQFLSVEIPFQKISFEKNFSFPFIFKKFIFILFESLITFNLFLALNFFRWKEINNRFKNARLFYEEGSWYDGKIWEKPFCLLKNDKILSIQKIEPILVRILNTLYITLLLLFILSFQL
jgi:hypothetical protein